MDNYLDAIINEGGKPLSILLCAFVNGAVYLNENQLGDDMVVVDYSEMQDFLLRKIFRLELDERGTRYVLRNEAMMILRERVRQAVEAQS